MHENASKLSRFALALTAGKRGLPPSFVVAENWAENAKAVLVFAEAATYERPNGYGECLERLFTGFHALTVTDRATLILWALERRPADEIAAVVDQPSGLVIGRAAEIAAELYERAMAGGSGCRILIAEDERVTALELKESLEEMGHEVPWVASSAGQAISAASLHRPVLAIMDIRLKGGTDGVSAAREIQETLGIPVILTTAYTDQETRAGTIAPYGFLPKPWSDEDLQRTLQATLARIAIERLTPGLDVAATPLSQA